MRRKDQISAYFKLIIYKVSFLSFIKNVITPQKLEYQKNQMQYYPFKIKG